MDRERVEFFLFPARLRSDALRTDGVRALFFTRNFILGMEWWRGVLCLFDIGLEAFQ